MAKKEVITPAGFTASGTPLSPGIKVGNTVYVSGQGAVIPQQGRWAAIFASRPATVWSASR